MAGPSRRFAVAAVFLVAAMALAGCTDKADDRDTPPEPGDDSGPPSADDGPTVSLDTYGARPIWFPGLQYSFDAEYTRPGLTGSITLTVVREEDGAFFLTPQADEELLYWAMVTHMPPIGRVEMDTLHPSIHDVYVAWFDFPLSDGKAWSGPDHHGTQVNYTTKRVEAQIPDGRRVPGYEVVGERAGLTWVQYTYTSEVGFFTEAVLDGNGDGIIDVILKMSDAKVTQEHLTLPTFEPHELAIHVRDGVQSLPEPQTEFTVPGDAVWLYVFFLFSGGPGHYSGYLTLPGGETGPLGDAAPSHTYNWTHTGAEPAIHTDGGVYNATAGDGSVGVLILGDGSIFAEVMAVRARPAGS